MDTQTQCKDRFTSAPVPGFEDEREWLGGSCTTTVEPGWACDVHHARVFGNGQHEADLTPRPSRTHAVANEADAAQAARVAEALEYVRSYTGRWGLILDLRADRKWGTKWFRMSDRLVDILLAGKARDAEFAAKRAAEATEAPSREREAEVRMWCVANAPRNPFALSLLNAIERFGRLTDRQYEAVVRNLPAAETADAPAPASEGWYRLDGDVYKVQKAVHGSGHLYAKRLVVDESSKSAEWVFAPGAVRRLNASLALTVEEAQAMGRLYGVCMVCGATLTDEASIERGIGPVCIKRLG